MCFLHEFVLVEVHGSSDIIGKAYKRRMLQMKNFSGGVVNLLARVTHAVNNLQFGCKTSQISPAHRRIIFGGGFGVKPPKL
jgi:hypothetical protein